MLVVSAGGFLIGSVGCEPVGCCVVSEGGRLGVGRGWGVVVTVLVVALLTEPDLLVDAPLTALVIPADAEVFALAVGGGSVTALVVPVKPAMLALVATVDASALAPVVGNASIIVPVAPVEAAMPALVVSDASIIAPLVLALVECVCI